MIYKYKGKVIQLITEEKSKGYGFIKYPNHDYIHVMPLEIWQHQNQPTRKIANKIMLWLFGLGILGFFVGFIIDFTYNFKFPDFLYWIPILLICGPIIFASIYNHFWNKKNFNKYWYFDMPIPVEKPHNFKLNDEIEITMDVTNEINKL